VAKWEKEKKDVEKARKAERQQKRDQGEDPDTNDDEDDGDEEEEGSVALHLLTGMTWPTMMRMRLRSVVRLHDRWRWAALPTCRRGCRKRAIPHRSVCLTDWPAKSGPVALRYPVNPLALFVFDGFHHGFNSSLML
jgi:hypothetical protein